MDTDTIEFRREPGGNIRVVRWIRDGMVDVFDREGNRNQTVVSRNQTRGGSKAREMTIRDQQRPEV